jgi:Rrf2 family protein
VRVSAKADYAVRAVLELAGASQDAPVKGEDIARAQDIPPRFLENILSELRQQGVVQSRRGADGGYWLAREPNEITIAEVIRAVDGPLATVRGEPPAELSYTGRAEPLAQVWIALQANVRAVLDEVTLADVVNRDLPVGVRELSARPGAPASG